LTADPASIVGQPGVVNPLDVQTELIVAIVALFVPVLSVIFNRLWFGPALVALIVAAGRVFITANGTTSIGVYGGVVGGARAGRCIWLRSPSAGRGSCPLRW